MGASDNAATSARATPCSAIILVSTTSYHPSKTTMQPSSMSWAKHATLIILPLFVLKCGDTIEMKIERRLADRLDPGAYGWTLKSPYLEYILREFLFKTISPPPPANNKLYRELLEAPFYTGPFPAAGAGTLNYDEGDMSEVLSRGDVYHLGEGGWIICQEGCIDCEICTIQRSFNVPTVKWILRKIQRLVPFAGYSKRNDIQLTVLPQADNSFHMKNLAPSSYVYVQTSNSEDFASFTDTLIRKNKDHSLWYPFGTTKPTESKAAPLEAVFYSPKDKDYRVVQENTVTEGRLQESFKQVSQTDSQLETNATLIPKPKIFNGKKRGRDVLQVGQNRDHFNSTQSFTPLTLFYPTTVSTTASVEAAECEKEKSTQLILGRDQSGQKHVIHIVPAADFDQEMTRPSVYPGARLVYHQPPNLLPMQNKHDDRTLYRKIFRRVIDSLNTHKNAIEKFLLSPKRDLRRTEFEKPSIVADGISYDEEKPNNTMRNDISKFVDGTQIEDTTTNDFTNSSEKVSGNNEDIFLTSTTTELYYEGEVELDTTEEVYDIKELSFTTENNQTQELNNDVQKFDESALPDELTERGNNSESLILKEVAKSVVKRPADTLQGFNFVTNTNLDKKSHDRSLTTSNGNTGSIEHLNRGEKRRRHV